LRNPGATRRGAPLRPLVWGKPRATAKGYFESSGLEGTRSHPAKGLLRAPWAWGNPGATRRGEPPDHWSGENPGPPAKGNLKPTGLGETWSHPAKASLVPPGTGGSSATRRWGIPEPPVIWATGALVRLPGPVGGRAAQRTLSNRRDGVARLGEAPPSHTWRGLVLLCPSRQNRARTDTPPHERGHS